MVHKIYQKALTLRKQGKSYSEIKKILGIPKSTLSSWFKDMRLSEEVRLILTDKRKKGMKGLMRFNKNRTFKIKKENDRIRKKSLDEVKNLSRRELLLIGTALYWAEGYNRQENNSSPYISFGNSNPQMISLFLRFLEEVLNIPEEDLHFFVQIHYNIQSKSAINFWSRITKIPKNRFHIIYQVSRASRGKRPYNSLPYGTLRIDARGRLNFFKIKGWIDGLSDQGKK